MFLSQCEVCSSKKSRFINEQETGGLLDQNVSIRRCFFLEYKNEYNN